MYGHASDRVHGPLPAPAPRMGQMFSGQTRFDGTMAPWSSLVLAHRSPAVDVCGIDDPAHVRLPIPAGFPPRHGPGDRERPCPCASKVGVFANDAAHCVSRKPGIVSLLSLSQWLSGMARGCLEDA